jgi:uncharacterized protein YcnI
MPTQGRIRRNGRRALRRALPAIWFAASLAMLVAAPTAMGHAVVRPAASRPAELQSYTLTVPTEKRTPTVSVAMQVPEGIEFFLVRDTPGWNVKVERRGGRISVVRWAGGSIPRDSYQDFEFIARNPVRESSIAWKVVQRYAGGDTVRWVGPADSDSPAAQTRLAEDVVPQDVVDVESGKTSGSGPADPSGSVSGAKGSGSGDDDSAALIVAIAALVAAVAALGMSLAGRLRKKET